MTNIDKVYKKMKIYEKIAEDLKQQILGKEIKSGELLPSVPELCNRYQVSRSTVREALSALKIMGYIETKQGEGSTVKKIEPEDIELPDFHRELVSKKTLIELKEARKSLELSIVLLAASKRTEDDLKKLQSILNKMELNLITNDQEESEKLDMDFHIKLAEATHNSILTRLLLTISSPLAQAMQTIRRASYSNFSNVIFQEHHNIYLAVLNKDSENAHKYMALHLDHFEEKLSQSIYK